MDRHRGDNGPPFDDDFGWDEQSPEEETVEVRSLEPTAPPPPPRRPPPRTLASDLRRLRDRGPLPILAAVAVLVIVAVVIVLAVTRDGGEEPAAELTPPPATITEEPATEPAETPATESGDTAETAGTADSTDSTDSAETTESPDTTETPPVSGIQDSVTLRVGDQGPAVTELQQALAQLGFFAAEPDGVYGEQTQAAVEAFQESAGLTIDGTAGPETAQAINQSLQQVG